MENFDKEKEENRAIPSEDKISDEETSNSDLTSEQQSLEVTLSLSDIGDITPFIEKQESLWSQIEELKSSEDNYENRLALKETYINLAIHYSQLRSNEAATKLLKNAYEIDKDERTLLDLARLQGQQEDFEFIINYEKLIKTGQYDLKLTLEYCYFLENHKLHEAALNILEVNIQKRAKDLFEKIDDEVALITSFFTLLQAKINLEAQPKLDDYIQIFNIHFPKAITEKLAIFQTSLTSTIVGEELEEYEKEHGLLDELRQYKSYLIFVGKHYRIPFAIGITSLMLICLTLFRVPHTFIQNISSILFIILLFLLSFDILRSFRLNKTSRLRTLTKAVNNIVLTSFAMILLNFIGPMITRSYQNFFPPIIVKIFSLILLSSLLWKTYLSIEGLKKTLKESKEYLLQRLKSRTLRRQIANLVYGSSKWSLILGLSLWLTILLRKQLYFLLY